MIIQGLHVVFFLCVYANKTHERTRKLHILAIFIMYLNVHVHVASSLPENCVKVKIEIFLAYALLA